MLSFTLEMDMDMGHTNLIKCGQALHSQHSIKLLTFASNNFLLREMRMNMGKAVTGTNAMHLEINVMVKEV
jgi:hypothetical protein